MLHREPAWYGQQRKGVLRGKVIVSLPQVSHTVRYKYLWSALNDTCEVGIEDKT